MSHPPQNKQQLRFLKQFAALKPQPCRKKKFVQNSGHLYQRQRTSSNGGSFKSFCRVELPHLLNFKIIGRSVLPTLSKIGSPVSINGKLGGLNSADLDSCCHQRASAMHAPWQTCIKSEFKSFRPPASRVNLTWVDLPVIFDMGGL